jgi:hypothetical protein
MSLNIDDLPLDCGMGGNPHRFLRIARKKKFHAKIAAVSGFQVILLLSA